MAEGKETVLIYRLGSMGDMIVALPCFHAIRRHFPEARRLLLTNIPVSPAAPSPFSVLGPDFVDDIIPYPLGIRSLGTILSLMRTVRASGARTAIYLMPPRSAPAAWRDWVFLRACGVSRILCFPHTADLRHPRINPDNGEWEQEGRRLARCCSPFGPVDMTWPDGWDMRLTEAERSRGATVLAPLNGIPFLAVNMGGKVASKDWGEDNWAALIDRLAAAGNTPRGLLVVGADGPERTRAAALLAHWPGPGVNACGILPPRETAAVFESTKLFIGHDSGPLHLAACVGAPSLGLYGPPHPPGWWTPAGPQVTVLYEKKGLSALTVDTVAETALAMLRKAN